ncbi:MAG: hypothetical protein ABI651_01555, partial [Verrucomicrobiota bacterium]
MNTRILLRRWPGFSPAPLTSSPSRGFVLGLVCMAWMTNTVLGQFMLSPIAVKETGLGTFSSDLGALTNLINQSGLNVPFVSGSTDFDSYFAPPNSNFSKNRDGTKWQSEVSFTLPFVGKLDFDLGDNYLVSKVAIWNVSVKSLTVMVSADPGGPWLDAGKFSLSDQQPSLTLRAAVLDLGTEHPGRYVRLSIESEFPTNFQNLVFGYVTIGEVVVRAAPPGGPTVSIDRESNGDIAIKFT